MRCAFVTVLILSFLSPYALAQRLPGVHTMTLEEGFQLFAGGDGTGDRWQIATAHVSIRSADVGKPGAVFVGAANSRGDMLAFMNGKWTPFSSTGENMPTVVFDALPARHDIVLFNSRDLDRFSRPRNDYGLSGRTLCEAARVLGADDLAIGVGYGVIPPEAQEVIDKSDEYHGHLEVDHIRYSFVNADMLRGRKWNEVYRKECTEYEGS